MKFRADLIKGLFNNEQNCVTNAICSMKYGQKIVIAQGYGLRNTPIPLRLSSYTVGVIRLMQQLPANCTAELYVAAHGVLRANGYTSEIVHQQANKIIRILQNYAKAIHPKLADRIRVYSDMPIAPQSEVDRFIKELIPLGQEIVQEDDAIGSFVQKHGGIKAICYMIEHALYMRDPMPGVEKLVGALLKDASVSMDHMIMVGGPAERIFYRFRQALLRKIGSQYAGWQSHQFFMGVGNPPTYHSLPNEPAWDSVDLPRRVVKLLQSTAHIKTASNINTTVLRDLTVMLLDCGGAPDFKMLGAIERAIKGGAELQKDTEDLLQYGWERLLQLWRD